MTVYLNKTPIPCPEPLSVAFFMEKNGLFDRPGIALAVNDEVVPKSLWNTRILKDNDKLTLIGATAGG